jgi:protein-tyrosine-phosphatase
MSEVGANLDAHSPRTLDSFGSQTFDVVIAFTSPAFEAAKAYFAETDSQVLHWPLPEPGEGSLDVRAIMNNYRAMRDLIKNRLIRHFGTP